MDINRQISAEKYVYVCVESLEFIFRNVHKSLPIVLTGFKPLSTSLLTEKSYLCDKNAI